MNNHHVGSDVNQVEPLSLSRIRGRENVIYTLKSHLEVYFKVRSRTGNVNQSFGPVALVGPSGTGKTLVAKATHAELGNLHLFHTNGETINARCELFTILLDADEHTTIFIDEAQGMRSKTQHILLTAISERFLPISVGSARSPRGIQLKRFTLILATTHEYLLQEALRNRMRIYCRFQRYSVPDLVEIVDQRAQALGWSYESHEVLRKIAERAKGNARQALNRNLQGCWEMAQNHDHDSIAIADVDEAFSQMQIDELGLNKTDREYLQILAEDGHVALNVISSKLGLPYKTIQDVIEPYLIRENLVTKDRYSMRFLTKLEGIMLRPFPLR